MKKRKVLFIVNPKAGQKEPVLSYIKQAYTSSFVDWEIKLTKRAGDGSRYAKDAASKHSYDIIAAYGGDGTVSEIVHGLYGFKDMVLGIIPGGTANVFAKELMIPIDTIKALEVLKSPVLKQKTIDLALVNNKPVLLGLVIGLWADVVRTTPRSQKEKFGQLAYGFNAIQKLNTEKSLVFSVQIDDKPRMTIKGPALFVSNAGNIGFRGVSLTHSMKVDDGFLDLFLIKHINISAVSSFLSTHIFRRKPTGSLRHWKFKKLLLSMDTAHTILHDDVTSIEKSLHVVVVPKALRVVVPTI